MPTPDQDRAALFEQNRRHLFGIAYRMLGTRTDAEDMVQEAYLRWHRADLAEVKVPQAWLTAVVTRLCIDRLRSASVQREQYPGEWLPEPLVEPATRPDCAAELAENLSVAFLRILELLAPEERAVFLLREVFGEEYEEISHILGRSEVNCRQLLHRARERVHRDRRRFPVDPGTHQRLLERFRNALISGDAGELINLFAEDATWTADGGGLAPTAPRALEGRARIVQLLIGLLHKNGTQLRYAIASINGAPGLVIATGSQVVGTVCLDTNGSEIVAAWVVVNPEKLRGIVFPEDSEERSWRQ